MLMLGFASMLALDSVQEQPVCVYCLQTKSFASKRLGDSGDGETHLFPIIFCSMSNKLLFS